MTRFGLVIVGATLACLTVAPALAISGADALKQLNHDTDQTLELPEMLDQSARLFNELDKDHDFTLEKAEVGARVTAEEWTRFNKDRDGHLELDEWLNILRSRFYAADSRKTGKLTAPDLDKPAGQSLLKLVINQ